MDTMTFAFICIFVFFFTICYGVFVVMKLQRNPDKIEMIVMGTIIPMTFFKLIGVI